VKKLCTVFIGAGFMLSLSVNAAVAMKNKSFSCESDKRIAFTHSRFLMTTPAYTAEVLYINDDSVSFTAIKNIVVNKQIRKMVLSREIARAEEMNGYLTIQGKVWALAVAPEKNRASLYSSNPDINEVPMFCLSSDAN
jgi:hypothetical protein